MDKTLSAQQVCFLLFFLLIGSTLVYVPEVTAGPNAWISNLLGALPGLYVLGIILYLSRLFPGMSILQVSQAALGKAAGSLLNLILLSSLLLIAIGLIYDLSLFLKTIYIGIPCMVLHALIILTSAFCIYHGPQALGRLSEMFIWIILFFFMLGILMSVPLMSFNELKPVLADWQPVLAGAFYAADWPYLQLLMLAFFLPLVKDLKGKEKHIFGWFLMAAAILVIEDLQVISSLGQELSSITRFPVFKVTRLAGFGEFKRVELFLFLLWFIAGITAVIIYYQGLVLNIKEFLQLRNPNPIILPLGLCLVVFTSYMFPSDLHFINTRAKHIPFFTLTVNLLYPTVVLAAVLLKHPKRGTQGDDA